MQYKLIHWVRTDQWEGALIEAPDGRRYYTNGQAKWPVTPERERKVKIVPSIDVDGFVRRWNINYQYDTISGIEATVEGQMTLF